MFAAAIMAASLALTTSQAGAIDALVRQTMRADHVPGLSIGISRDGRLLFMRGYGMSDVASHAAANARTTYRVGSITKQFTAALVLQAIERGELNYDTELRGYRVSDLLAQTSGLPSYTDPGQTIESAMSAQPHFPAGAQWEYSNTNYYMLGTILETVVQESYAQLLSERITGPLHLEATTLGPGTAAGAALGYRWNGSRIVRAVDTDNDDPTVAFSASAIESNVPDLLAWLTGLENGSVVNASDFAAMATSGKLYDGTLTHYGYGFYIDNWYGWQIAQHPGLTDGFSSDDVISPGDGLAIVVLTNADKEPLVPLVKSVFAIVDPPKDPTMVATLTAPAVNEDPNATALARTIGTLMERAHAVGSLDLVEFVRGARDGEAEHLTYRLTYARAQYLLTLDLRGGRLAGASFGPLH